jgi:hypothetical protein
MILAMFLVCSIFGMNDVSGVFFALVFDTILTDPLSVAMPGVKHGNC